MATKKAKSDSTKAVKAQVKKLRSELASAESKRDRWKKRAIKAEAAAADFQTRLKVAEKSLKKATKVRAPAMPASPSEAPAATADVPAAPSVGESPATEGAADAREPDASWTVTELRAEARRRGIVGMSRKPKAEVLAALS